jgi:hypothetical protein
MAKIIENALLCKNIFLSKLINLIIMGKPSLVTYYQGKEDYSNLTIEN